MNVSTAVALIVIFKIGALPVAVVSRLATPKRAEHIRTHDGIRTAFKNAFVFEVPDSYGQWALILELHLHFKFRSLLAPHCVPSFSPFSLSQVAREITASLTYNQAMDRKLKDII